MRMVTTHARMFFVGLAVVASAGAASFQTLAAQAREPYSALVAPTEARVVFPVAVLGEWEWCRAETSNLALEYRWTATVQNGEHAYTFGFFLFKCLRSGPTRGTFDTLLKGGQLGVTELNQIGGRFLQEAKVGAVASATHLALVVNDAKTLRLLFSERPTHATLRTRLPGTQDMIREVPIVYSQR
jgi:hypothetical protein